VSSVDSIPEHLQHRSPVHMKCNHTPFNSTNVGNRKGTLLGKITRTALPRYISSCTKNPQQIAVVELEHYGRPKCSKQPRRVERRRRGQQARPSTSSVDNTIDLLWRNFQSPYFVTKLQKKYSCFWRYPNSLKTQCWIGERKPPSQNPARFV